MIYYFASINEESFVDAVHLIDEQYCLDDDNNFSEEKAVEYLNNFHGESRWLLTDTEGNIRYHYAGPGYYYYEEYDAFVPPKPEGDFILTEQFTWVVVDVAEYLESVEVI